METLLCLVAILRGCKVSDAASLDGPSSRNVNKKVSNVSAAKCIIIFAWNDGTFLCFFSDRRFTGEQSSECQQLLLFAVIAGLDSRHERSSASAPYKDFAWTFDGRRASGSNYHKKGQWLRCLDSRNFFVFWWRAVFERVKGQLCVAILSALSSYLRCVLRVTFQFPPWVFFIALV